MNYCTNHRFIERDFWFQKVLSGNSEMTSEMIDHMLDECGTAWCDLTFKFYTDGSVIIIDNDSNLYVSPRELQGAALDYYIRKRIDAIRSHLQEQFLIETNENQPFQLKYA
jgi:hypothetical protein